MKKITVLFFLFIGTFGYSQDWFKSTLAATVSVEFPSIPKFKVKDGMRIYSVSKEDYAITIVISEDPDRNHSTMKDQELEDHYDGIVRGALMAGENAKLLMKRKVKLDSVEGREIVFIVDTNDRTGVHSTTRFFLIQNLIYSISVWNLKESSQSPISDRFFNSMSLIN